MSIPICLAAWNIVVPYLDLSVVYSKFNFIHLSYDY